jgi:ankyrin repeat protein
LAQLQLGIFFHGKRTYHNHLDVEKQIEKLRENTTLPELNNVYQEIYGLNTNIDSIDRQLADKAYKLLLGAQRLLRLRELGAAVRTTTDNTNLDFVNATYLLEITANFIIAEEDDMNPVQLAHASVQEFLRTLNIEGSSRFTDVSVHAQAAETCLASLNRDQVWTPLPPLTDAEMNYETPREKTTSLTIHKFARYAALYWPRHSELAGATMRASGPLQKQLTTFLHNKEYAPFSQWTENLGHVRYGYSDSFGERFQDCEGATPLHITSIWDLSDVASHILKGTSTDCHEFNDRGDAPIHLAVKYRHPRTLRLLASHMSDALEFQNDKGLTVLHVAVKYSPLQLLSDLLDMGGNVDSKTKAGDTLLDLAIYQKNIPAVDLLLSRNASLTEINSEGDTALHRAAKSSRTVMEHLLRHGADVGIKNAYGQTPLHTVADWYPEDLGLIAKAKLLVDFGADPNARDENGKSALHVAAASGRKNIMEVIIEQAANVDINIKDNHGNSPLRFAATEEIADALVRAGADVNQRKPRRSYTIEVFEGPS